MNVIAVTACPTGIAHSQMAAENLETTAEERGHEISVEIEGAMGTENELSDERIANADVVVIAADTTVHTDRFGDLPIVKGTVKDAVNSSDELLDEAEEKAGAGAAAGSAPDAAAGEDASDAEAGEDASDVGAGEEAPDAAASEPDAADAGGSDAGADESDDQATVTAGEEDRSTERGERKGLVGKLKSLFS